MKGMSEHRRNIIVTDSLEANAWYNSRIEDHSLTEYPALVTMNSVIAEAYLMRAETITKGE